MTESLLKLIGGLVEKAGTRVAGIVCIGAGAIILLPYFGVPVYVAQGAALMAIGVGILAFGKWFVVSEAEKRISNPSAPSVSAVPAIQAEIVKQLNGGAEAHNDAKRATVA